MPTEIILPKLYAVQYLKDTAHPFDCVLVGLRLILVQCSTPMYISVQFDLLIIKKKI